MATRAGVGLQYAHAHVIIRTVDQGAGLSGLSGMDEVAAALGRFGDFLHGVGRGLEVMAAGFTRLDYLFILVLVLALALVLVWLRQNRLAEVLAHTQAAMPATADREDLERQVAAFGELWLAVDRLDRSGKEIEVFARSLQAEVVESREALRRQDLLLQRLHEAEQLRRRDAALITPEAQENRGVGAPSAEIGSLRADLRSVVVETARLANENAAAQEKLTQIDGRIAELDRLAEGARSLIRRLKMLTPKQAEISPELMARIEGSASRDMVEDLRRQLADLATEADRSRMARQRALGQLAALGRAYQDTELGNAAGGHRRLPDA